MVFQLIPNNVSCSMGSAFHWEKVSSWCCWSWLYSLWRRAMWWDCWLRRKPRWKWGNSSWCNDNGWVIYFPIPSIILILFQVFLNSPTHRVGAVGGMKRVKHAISVARKVMEHTEHTMLIGESATAFALQMGFPEEDLSTDHSLDIFKRWKKNSCQPNFWKVFNY